ncbi:TonB-dependent receptor [Sphingomonas sp. R1]|uniref:TonB-dependent receptor n=1 Tax=Sphingomonas sp. R1 TaxID=399176 RepID=UPI0022248D26|nr:TonB-dependent receptor [Sphingomonas sp. R1]UYY77533.1 TonB-dependent receptor [Sphingomonas sp. R1]
MHHRLRTILLASCVCAPLPTVALAVPAPALAQPLEATHAIDLPAQPLSDALRALSRQTGAEVMFDPALVAGRRAPAVRGRLTPRAALERLIAGAPIAIRYDGGAAMLVKGPIAPQQSRPAVEPARERVAADGNAVPGPQEETAIVVTGSYSDSIANALGRKRRADNVVDSIEAVDIAQFPTQNLAEALQRVPGVTIDRDRGEGLFVKVRGLGAQFQVTTLNGQSIAVNENIRDSGQSGRQFRFDTIPSELIAGVDVIKSPSANIEEGALGGTVNIRTFKPLDLQAGKVVASASGSYSEKANKVDPNFSGLASWKNANGTVGALIAAAYTKRSVRQDRLTEIGWANVPGGVDTDGDGKKDSGPVIAATGVRPTLEQEDRERYAVNAAVQFRPSSAINLEFEGFYTRLDDRYDELTYSVGLDYTKLVPGTAIIRDGVLYGGTSPTGTQISRDISDMKHENWFLGFKGDLAAGDWTFHPTAYTTKATSNTNGPITRTRLLGDVGRVKLVMPTAEGDRMPDITMLDSDLNKPGTLPFRRIEWRPLRSVDKEKAAGLSVERALDFGPLTRIEFGAKYRTRDRNYQRRDLNITTLTGKFFDASYFNAFPFNDFLGGTTGTLPKTWLQPDPDPFWIASDTSGTQSSTLTRADLRNSYRIGEDITTGYAMTSLETQLGGIGVRGNIGLRYAHTRQTSAGHADNGKAALPVSYVSSYDDVMPSANLVFEPQRDLLIRLAAAKVITRPSLAQLAPRLTLNSSGTIFTAVGGNPNLKRYQAWQYDATAEYYFAPKSALIAGVFYKDIGTFVYNQVTDFVVDGTTYKLTAPTNGGDAKVWGIELAYQQPFTFLPGPLKGLGVQANYTLTDTKASYSATLKDQLENVARHSFNLTGFYEMGPFEAWLSYSWRGKVLQAVGTNDFLAVNEKPFGTVDGSISLRVARNAQVSLQGINILDRAQVQYVANNLLGGYTDYGRTVRLTGRVNF